MAPSTFSLFYCKTYSKRFYQNPGERRSVRVDLGLKDATAVVVGGGRGMGFAAARCLAEDGARVVLVGRTQEVVDRAAEGLTGRGSPDAVGLVADTTDASAVQRVFVEIGERWNGGLNILINAVGPGTRGTFEELTDEQWREAFDDGVMGMVHCVRSALPLLRRAEWARIVNFSAHSTQRQTVILPAYTAAKAAVTSISKNLSLLLAKDEIMVNVVSPGSIASEALVGWAASVGVDGGDPYALMAAIDKHFGHPAHMPRAGLPDEIGPVVAFLASRRNSYMTGANINVDGGSDFT
jgi:3-oxoacyl-[acyl-carrier protein] reductase